MRGHIPVHDASRADVEHDEDIEDAKVARDRGEEVTREDRVGVIPHERRPALGGPTAADGRRRYRPTVRGDTVSPSFNSSSSAIRSSPHGGVARAMGTM